MIRAVSYASSTAVFVVISFLIVCSHVNAQAISFDCPAFAEAIPIFETEGTRVIEVPLAVSNSINDSGLVLEKVRADVCWNRIAYPLVDYGPKTILQSEIEGAINVEERLESDLGFTGSLTGGHLASLGTPNLNAELRRKKTMSNTYARIPQHEAVVSSGPIKRSTGAYFEFRPSRTESLEGGRNLVVAFEVPVSWRAGILQITCHAAGNRKRMGIFNDRLDYSRIFVVPVYLKGDDQALKAATALAHHEQELRSQWHRYRSHQASNHWNTLLILQNNDIESSDRWMHHLIQSGSDRALRQVESRLPEPIQVAANEFHRARQALLQLSR